MAKGFAGLVIALVNALLVSTRAPFVSVRALVEVPFVVNWVSTESVVACFFLGVGVSVSAHPAKIRTRKRGSKRSDDFILVSSLGDHLFVS